MSKFAEKLWVELMNEALCNNGIEGPNIIDAALKKQREVCARAFGANFYLEDSPLWNLHGDKIRKAILNAEVEEKA